MARTKELLGPVQLNADQVKQLRGEMDKYKKAMAGAQEAFGTLWSAQLDLAISTGRADFIDDVLGNPVGFLDNCDCNTCGGGTGPAGAW